ncbi:magnesium transporter MRS2-11, chloroplastic-like isoform X3 [Durio zibethinus]|uniref:Magnesium transporter MRS2-11, chloroplastic-like isoform X3 n=1 Tax=Durio zibethinus TaxID=66656 RepID=A0A6P5ZSU6_DURZI|nr:magnesium transporter MRS2-11, chloroplastic-like isoform X3 [Durio zibethinus]
MAVTTSPPSVPNLLQFSVKSPSPSVHYLLFGSPWPNSSPIFLQKSGVPLLPVAAKPSSKRIKCFARSSTEQDRLSKPGTLAAENVGEDDDDDDGEREDSKVQQKQSSAVATQRITSSTSDSLLLGIREPVYEVVEVKANGVVSIRKINRRQLLKSSGLRPRDIRSVDPSLFLTNSAPSLLVADICAILFHANSFICHTWVQCLGFGYQFVSFVSTYFCLKCACKLIFPIPWSKVREHAILLNLGSLRAIAMRDRVLIFDYNCKGGKAFTDTLLPRLNNMNGGHCMPFELEVVEAALLSRIQHLEQRLMDLEPRVQALLEVLPNKLTGDILEQLRISKQTLVELGSRAGALRQMLLDLLEDPHEIRRISIMGRNCTLKRGNDDVECSVPLEKLIAEEEEEEIEMLLENYLQRYFWHELEVLSGRTCVCVLANHSRDYCWRCCGIFSHVFIPES